MRYRYFCFLSALIWLWCSGANAAQVTATWIGPGGVGGPGNWNVAANWSGNVVPNNGTPVGTTYRVVIDGGFVAGSVVTVNNHFTVDSLTTSSGDTLNIISNGQVTVVNSGGGTGTIVNAGSIIIDGTGAGATLAIDGNVPLTGSGTVVMISNGNINGTSGGRLTNVDNTISGTGNIGSNNITLTNQATIVANIQNGTLSIDPVAADVINTGTMRAENGGRLNINHYVGAFEPRNFINTNGIIRANAGIVSVNTATVTGGTVDVVGAGLLLLESGTVTGGTITNSATGVINCAQSGGTIGGTITNPAGGVISVNTSGTLELLGGAGNSISNGGNIALSNGTLRINGDVSLTGGGTVTMSNTTSNAIVGTVGTNRLTNVNNTISGAGGIGAGPFSPASMAFTNQGTVIANQTSRLMIKPSVSGCINTGTIRSEAGSTLLLTGNSFANTGGLIRANGGRIDVSSATVTGGTVDVVGAGLLVLTSGGSVTGGTLTNSTTGTISIGSDGINTIGGTITNPAGGKITMSSGTLVLLGGAGNSITNAGNISTGSGTLRINGDVSLTGGGTVTMSNGSIVGTAVTNRFTNVNNTISGSGIIGAGPFSPGSMAFTNQGSVIANQTSSLTIKPSASGCINTGTTRSEAGSTLQLAGNTFTNTGGLIRANGGRVDVISTSVTGGTVDVVGAGLLLLGDGTVAGGTLTNSSTGTILSPAGAGNTIGGVVTNPAGGQIIVAAGSSLTLLGGAGNSYNNAGNIALNATGSSLTLRIDGAVSLTGGGTVTMSNSTGNAIVGTNTGHLTNVNNTISGAGSIGGNAMLFTNQGTVMANQTGILRIDVAPPANGFTSSGTVQVNAGSTLNMGNDDVFTQTSGSTVVNGALNLNGGTTVQLQGGTLGGTGTINGLVNNSGGTIAPGTSPGILNENGNYTQGANGKLNIELNGAAVGVEYDQLKVNGTVTLGGTLSLNVGNGFTPASGAVFNIINNDGTDAVSGTFSGRAEGAIVTASGRAFRISYIGGDGNDVVLTHLPLITINDITVAEGNSGTVNATFTLTLSPSSGQTITVQYATANSSAIAGSDYNAVSGTLTFSPGVTTRSVTIQVLGDVLDEENETFRINLSNAANAVITDAQGIGTITDDDDPPSLTVSNPRAFLEGSAAAPGSVTLGVRLSVPSGKTVRVNYQTADGLVNAAVAGQDYVAQSGTLTFAPGQTLKTVTVPFVGEAIAELNEQFFLDIKTPINATIADSRGKAFIGNDDGPSISIDNAVSVQEGNSGTRAQNFVVKLSAASTNTVTVNWATGNGPATGGAGPADFTVANGTLSFAPGETSKTITIQVKGDTTVEPTEKYFVNLTRPTFAIIADSQGSGFILNDDTSAGIAQDAPSQ